MNKFAFTERAKLGEAVGEEAKISVAFFRRPPHAPAPPKQKGNHFRDCRQHNQIIELAKMLNAAGIRTQTSRRTRRELQKNPSRAQHPRLASKDGILS